MDQNDDKLAAVQATLQDQIETARKSNQGDVRDLHVAVTELVTDPCFNVALVHELAVRLRRRVIDIEQAGLRARSSQGVLCGMLVGPHAMPFSAMSATRRDGR